MFACSKFHLYIYGFHAKIQSDYNPLESMMLKPLQKVSPRLQRMHLKLQKYYLEMYNTKGTQLYVADTLSHTYLNAGPEPTVRPVRFWPNHFLLGAHPLLVNVWD